MNKSDLRRTSAIKTQSTPAGTGANRATKASFEATGRDKAIYSKNNPIWYAENIKCTRSRAPNGQKSDWIMHEYRLETNDSGTSQARLFNCQTFKKKIATTVRNEVEHESLCWYDDQVSFMPNFDSQRRQLPSQLYNNPSYHPHQYPSKQDLDLQYNMHYHHHHDTNAFLHHLPPLDSPKLQQSTAASCSTILPCTIDRNSANILQSPSITQDENQVTDWRVLDRFVASQLSEQKNDDNNNASMEAANSNGTEDLDMFMIDKNTQEMTSELESVTKSSPQVDMWK
ncbi:hypothetical protein Leryth_000856 [Lithospermum erythrorhizon]|nr:hypothetical protein Leryth_000856 [Lithospermum erythrorhizon]